MTFAERLKSATAVAHARIERDFRLTERTATPEAYRALLARLYGVHSVWEQEGAALIADAALFEPRRKAALLRRDLRALGQSEEAIARLPVCHLLLEEPTRAAAFGAMYVIEGSSLGGAVIARRVEQALKFDATNGCAFFHTYGSDRGAMWRSFRGRLEEFAATAHEEEIISAAQATFERMRLWLCEDDWPAECGAAA